MKATKAHSTFGKVDYVDVLKSLRAGSLALVSVFVSGALGATQNLGIDSILNNPKAVVATVVLAGFTAAFDLLRRWLTDYGEL